MQGFPTKSIILEPWWGQVSKIEIAAFKAHPVATYALLSTGINHGSGYKSSNIEFNANSHSVRGNKNLKNIKNYLFFKL